VRGKRENGSALTAADTSPAAASAPGSRARPREPLRPQEDLLLPRFTAQEFDYIQQAVLLEVWDQAPALVFVADEQMRYVAVNATVCKILGYTREEMLSLRVTDVAVAADAAELYESMIEVGENSGRTPIRAKDGTIYLLEYQAGSCDFAGVTYYTSVGFAKPLGATREAAATLSSATAASDPGTGR
jgi:PAS domain S-box-containing protein